MTQRIAAGGGRRHTGYSRTPVGVAAAALLVAWLAGCGTNEREKLSGETVATMEELNKLLDGVKDEPSAKVAAPKMNELVDRWAGQMDRLRQLGGANASDPPAKLVGAKYEERYRDAARGIGLNLMAFRLDIGIRRHLEDPIARYDKAMKAAPTTP